MQLAPGETFTVVRQLDDPNDSGTYYVKAVIRDAATDAVLDTLYLTNQGGQRFSKTWTVYSKRSNGFYIAVSTQVFTDAAYTSYSDVYGQEIDTYLVEQRLYHQGMGGGTDISYKRIQQIVEEVVKGLPPHETVDIAPIIAREVDRAVKAAEAATEAIAGVEIAPVVHVMSPKVDLSPILEAVNQMRVAHAANSGDAQASRRAIETLATELSSAMKDLLQKAEIAHAQGNETLGAAAQAAFSQVRTVIEHLSSPFEALSKAAPTMKEAFGSEVAQPIKAPEEIIREIRSRHG